MAKTMIPEAKVCRAREPKGAKHIFSVPVHSDIFIYAMLFFVTFVDFTNCIPSYSYVQYFCLLIVALFLCLKFFASKLSHFDLFSLVFFYCFVARLFFRHIFLDMIIKLEIHCLPLLFFWRFD